MNVAINGPRSQRALVVAAASAFCFSLAPFFFFSPRGSILSACFSKPGMCTDDRYSRQSSDSSSNGNARASSGDKLSRNVRTFVDENRAAYEVYGAYSSPILLSCSQVFWATTLRRLSARDIVPGLSFSSKDTPANRTPSCRSHVSTSKASRDEKTSMLASGTMDAPLRLSASGCSAKCPETMRRNSAKFRGFRVLVATWYTAMSSTSAETASSSSEVRASREPSSPAFLASAASMTFTTASTGTMSRTPCLSPTNPRMSPLPYARIRGSAMRTPSIHPGNGSSKAPSTMLGRTITKGTSSRSADKICSPMAFVNTYVSCHPLARARAEPSLVMREDAPSPDSARSHASASANANAISSYGSTPFPFAAAAGGLAASSEAPRAENGSRFFLRSASSTATLSPTRTRSAAGPTRSPLTNAGET